MQWQELTFTVLAVLQAVAPSQGRPHHPQQLVYYNQLVPRQSANLLIVPSDAGAIQQFAASGVPLPVGGQYVVVQPGATPVLYVSRAEGEKPDEGGSGGVTGVGFIDNIVNFVTGNLPPNPFPAIIGGEKPKPDEKPNDNKDKEKPEKLEGSSEQPQSASLEKFDEDEPPKNVPVVPVPGQRFVVIGQPQFFGNFDALRNHAVQESLGAGPSYFLVKNQPVSGKLEERIPAPGTSAIEFQRLLQQHAADQHKDDSVTVDALKSKPHLTKVKTEGEEEEGEDAENVEANPPGPSVAQVKPQAIALAGPGGMAAAAPIGTAVVGPEGIAVSSPHATAVAGPSGGPPGGVNPSSVLSSPAAYKAYILEQQSKGTYTPGSYHVAYSV